MKMIKAIAEIFLYSISGLCMISCIYTNSIVVGLFGIWIALITYSGDKDE